jgi:hypothetical protein
MLSSQSLHDIVFRNPSLFADRLPIDERTGG